MDGPLLLQQSSGNRQNSQQQQQQLLAARYAVVVDWQVFVRTQEVKDFSTLFDHVV